MEQIIRNYGKVLLEGVVAALLLLLILSQIRDGDGNRGIFQIVGAQIGSESTDYRAYTDFDVYETDASKAPPVIRYLGENQIQVGECCLSDYIEAESCSGTKLPIKIVEVFDQSGAEVACEEEMKVVFAEAGIYTIKVQAIDERNKRTVRLIRIPVNE